MSSTNPSPRRGLGGFLNLSGLLPNSLSGTSIAGGRLEYCHRLTGPGAEALVDQPIFVGGSLVAGNVWGEGADSGSGTLHFTDSVLVGADTVLGPVYLAYGRTDDRDSAVHLFLGHSF